VALISYFSIIYKIWRFVKEYLIKSLDYFLGLFYNYGIYIYCD